MMSKEEFLNRIEEFEKKIQDLIQKPGSEDDRRKIEYYVIWTNNPKNAIANKTPHYNVNVQHVMNLIKSYKSNANIMYDDELWRSAFLPLIMENINIFNEEFCN